MGVRGSYRRAGQRAESYKRAGATYWHADWCAGLLVVNKRLVSVHVFTSLIGDPIIIYVPLHNYNLAHLLCQEPQPLP